MPIVARHIVIIHSLCKDEGGVCGEHGASILPLNRHKRNVDGTVPMGRIAREKRNDGMVSSYRRGRVVDGERERKGRTGKGETEDRGERGRYNGSFYDRTV